jgi:predicted nucleic acid-binding protein
LGIGLLPLDWGDSLPLARRFGRSVCDAAYLTLAEKLAEQFITGGERLYNAVKGKQDWVLWIGEYHDE